MIPISPQCELLSLCRSSCFKPSGEDERNLRIMRLIDEQFTRTPFYGARRMTAWLRRNGQGVGKKRVRYVLSWKLSTTLDKGFCLEAMRRALLISRPEIFNADQGAQFTSEGFTGILEGEGIKVSMDGRGRVYDNIFVERLWRPRSSTRVKMYFRIFLEKRLLATRRAKMVTTSGLGMHLRMVPLLSSPWGALQIFGVG